MASSSSPASAAGVIPNAPPVPYPFDSYRDRLEYELTVRQEPKQARMCGVGGKADRRPIDPPPIVQLVVVDPLQKTNSNRRGSPATMPPGSPTPSAATVDRDGNSATPTPNDASATAASYAQSYLQNPYYFMFASLAKPDDDAELHWLKDNRTRCTTGSVVSSLYHLKDPQSNRDAGFFVFPDLSVRTEGSYRLKLSLYEVVGPNVRHCKSIFSAPFYVYTAKKFPGMEESTPLSCSLADQGIKIRIRKDIRVRKRPVPAFSADASHPVTGTNATDTNTHQSTFDAQSPFGGPPNAMPMQPPAAYQSTPGYYPPSQQPYNHTYASFPVPPSVQQYHPLAPPPGSIPASGPLQPLPPESQPGWGQQNAGETNRDMRSRSRSRSRTPASADEREGERGRGRTRHGSVTDDGDEEDRMDVEGEHADPRSEGQRDEIETIGGEDSDNDEYRPTSSSSKATSKAFTQSARRSTLPGTRATTSTRRSGPSAADNIANKVPGSDRETRSKKGSSKNSPKLKSVKSASSRRESRENKRARTENYQYQHQPIAPAPWAPAPHPSLTPSSSSSASLPSGVPAPINDPSLSGESIGGLPPGVRIPPPPGATIAPGAPSIAHNGGVTMTGNGSGSARNANTTPTPMTIRIPPPPGASIDLAPPSAGSAAVPGSANTNTNNSNTSPTSSSHASTTDIGNGNPDGSVQNMASTSGYQHPPAPYEQHSQPPQPSLPPPSSYSVPSHSYPVPSHAPNQQGYGVPSASLAPPPHSSQYPSHPPQHQQPGPLPPPPPHYGGYHQMPPHPQYAYGHPPQMMPPPPSTPQGYTAYPAPAAPPGGNSWGVGVQPPNPNSQMLDQYPHQQQMQMQMHMGQMQMQQPQYQQQPQYGYQQVRYEYGQAQHQIQPQSQHHLQPPQMYAPYAPIPAPPYGYYDPSSGQQPPPQNPSQATSSGQPFGVNTPPPNAIGVAPVPLSGPGHPPSQSQLQQAQPTTPSNVNVNNNNNNGGGGYVDYGSGYVPPRAGSPRGMYYREQQQQQQQQQYGYLSHPGPPLVHPPPPHAPVQPQSHPAHAMQLQHPQHHPYPPPYGVGGYMAYGNNGNSANNGSMSTTPGTYAPSSNNGEIWGANAAGSGAPTSWDASSSSSSTAATSAGTAPNITATGGYHSTPPQQQQVGALGSPGDRIQLAPLRVQQTVQPIDDSSPSMYPSVIQLRSSSRSRDVRGPGSGSGTTEVTNISSSGRERERERGRERDREKEGEGSTHRDRDREGARLDRSRDERGKKNPLAIGSIIESG